MNLTILTPEQELLGDQVAGLFYVAGQTGIGRQIMTVLSGTTPEIAAAITGATLDRLYSEQVVRREYLASAFQLQDLPRVDQEVKLLEIASGGATASSNPEAASQLAYYTNAYYNLMTYEIEQWQAENLNLIKVVLDLPGAVIEELITQLTDFQSKFYQTDTYRNLERSNIPPALMATLDKAGLSVRLNRFESITEKSRYLMFVHQLCSLIKELRTGGVTDQTQIITAVSTALYQTRF